jgi:hypothetical protein
MPDNKFHAPVWERRRMSGQKASASSIKCGGFLDSERGFAYPEEGRVLRRGSTQPFQTADGSLNAPASGPAESTARGVLPPRAVFDSDQHHVCMITLQRNERNKKDVPLHQEMYARLGEKGAARL